MSFFSDIFSPIGKALTAPIRWGGDIIEKAGDITGIDPIKYLGRGIHDFTDQPMVQNIAGIAPLAAAGYFAAPYISELFSPASTALPEVLEAGAAGAGGAGATTGITATAPLFAPEELALGTSGASFTGGVGGLGAATPGVLGATPSFFSDPMEWITANPGKSLMYGLGGANLLSSVTNANMMEGVNEGQQESWRDYLNALNPPESVKATRFGQLAENVRTQGNLTQKKIDESLAARGVRGKGKAAPTGDVAEATRESLNDAYNAIFGQYNVPSAPGPVNYAPNALQLAGQNTAAGVAQGIPLMLLLSKYGMTSHRK